MIDNATFELMDAESLEQAVLAEVRHCVWTATGGSDGCALCRGRTFLQRIEAGHLDCAHAMAVMDGANAVLADLKCGGLKARVWNWLYPTDQGDAA